MDYITYALSRENKEIVDKLSEEIGVLEARMKSMYSMVSCGADNTGIEDCSGVLSAIVSEIRDNFLTSGQFDQPNVIVFESGKYVFEKGVEIPPYCKIRVQGAVEIISKVNGALFSLVRNSEDLSEIHYEKKAMYSSPFIDGTNGGLLIYNNNYPINTDGSIAIQFGSTEDFGSEKSVSFTGINNVTIVGFNEGVRICSHNTYCIKIARCHISRCSIAINYYTQNGSSSNSGENFIYEDCIIEGADIVSNHMYQFIDENYINCSIDYNNRVFYSTIDFPRSKIHINGGHIEGWGIVYNNSFKDISGIVTGNWGNSCITLSGVCLVSTKNDVKPFSVPYYGKLNIKDCTWDVINGDKLNGRNKENWFVSDNVLLTCDLNGKIPFGRPFSSPVLNEFISGNYTEAYMSTSEGYGLVADSNILVDYLLKYGLGGDNTVIGVSNLTFKKVSDFYWDSAKTMKCRQIDFYATNTGESYIEIVTPFLDIDKIKYAIFDSPYINGHDLKVKVEYYNVKKELIKTKDYYTTDEEQKNGVYMQSLHFTLENNILNAPYCKIYFKYYFGVKNAGDEVSICPVFVEKIS